MVRSIHPAHVRLPANAKYQYLTAPQGKALKNIVTLLVKLHVAHGVVERTTMIKVLSAPDKSPYRFTIFYTDKVVPL